MSRDGAKLDVFMDSSNELKERLKTGPKLTICNFFAPASINQNYNLTSTFTPTFKQILIHSKTILLLHYTLQKFNFYIQNRTNVSLFFFNSEVGHSITSPPLPLLSYRLSVQRICRSPLTSNSSSCSFTLLWEHN